MKLPHPAIFPLALAFATGCNRDRPAEPAAFDAGPARMSLARAMGFTSDEKPPPVAPTDADFVKLGKREIDWDLDKDDPAFDYVERYVESTRRYGLERNCVHAQPSRVENGRTLVDTRDSSDGNCKGTNAVRDTFAVFVDQDRLELADPTRGAPLGDWPDGSSPTGMPTPAPKEGPPIDQWVSPLPKAFEALQLVPLRVQFYGRGSYPVISIAAWHGPMTLASSPAQLAQDARKICEASAGFPLGVIATMDRSTVLRIRCPESTRWDHL